MQSAIILFSICVFVLSGCAQSEQSPIAYPIETSPPLGVTVIVDGPAPVLGIVIGKNREVLHVEPSSAAEKAGIQLGDVIEQVNGISLGGRIGHVKQLISQSQEDTKLKVVITRSDTAIEVAITPAIIDIPDHTIPLPTVTPVLWPQDYLWSTCLNEGRRLMICAFLLLPFLYPY